MNIIPLTAEELFKDTEKAWKYLNELENELLTALNLIEDAYYGLDDMDDIRTMDDAKEWLENINTSFSHFKYIKFNKGE